jgi:hypothetical protein
MYPCKNPTRPLSSTAVELMLILLSQEAYRERTFKWEVLSQVYGYTTAFAKKI